MKKEQNMTKKSVQNAQYTVIKRNGLLSSFLL